MSSVIVRSVMLKAEVFQALEIEVHLVPGLPTILFLGLPSPGLKESATRIRSALRASGYQMPRGRQVLVDIRPREEKKHGRGVDLAVAAGYLMLTGQVDASAFRDVCFYGDVGLSGDVMAPSDWARVRVLLSGELVTGVGPVEGEFRSGRGGEDVRVVSHLRNLMRPRRFQAAPRHGENVSCTGGRHGAGGQDDSAGEISGDLVCEVENSLLLEESQAELARVAAVGGHSLLLAGPQGTGKSTLARLIHCLRPEPTIDESCEIETWSGESERPLVEPHHTAGELAMVGGRQPPRPGAITRAHLGTLLLDEVLLFRPEVQEALREPLETGVVHLARGPEARKFPADFQLIGTTNLCECGMYTPNSDGDRCRCPSRVRSRFEGRLRGPFVDRFQMLAFSNKWQPSQGSVSIGELREAVARAHEFQMSCGRLHGNRRWRPGAGLSAGERVIISKLPKEGSERRRLSILRLARTFADLEQRAVISERDVYRAKVWALDTFTELLKEASARSGFGADDGVVESRGH